MRQDHLTGLPARVVGIAFVIWGLHKLDYPWLRDIDWLAPWGFLLASVLEILVALCALLAYFDKARQDLGESEKFNRRIVDTANEGIWIIDSLLITTYVNQKMADMLGRSPAEMLGKPYVDFLLPDDVEAFEASMVKRRQGLAETYERRYLHRDGHHIWFLINATPILDERGKFSGALAMYTDITERKRMEEDARAGRLFLSDLIENSGTLIFVKDHSGRYELVNAKWEEVTGLKRGEVLGKTDEELFPGEIGRQFRLNDLTAMDSGTVLEKEEMLENVHGRRYFISIKFPLRSPDGEVKGVCGMTTEITERKLAEEALEKRVVALSRPLDDINDVDFHDLFQLEDIQRLQDLFARATGVASIITKPDGTPITRPSNFCRLCNDIIRKTDVGLANCYASDAILGRHHPEGPVVQPCLGGGLWDAGASITVGGKHLANWLIGQVRNETQTEEPMLEYARSIGADEVEFMAAFREVPTMSEDQFSLVAEALFALAHQLSTTAYQNVQQARFITERKQAEARREAVEAQLLQSQKMEAIGTLAGGIAHDFNNILGAVMGFAEIAKGDAEAGQVDPRDIEQILVAAERAKKLVQQIMTFSRKVEPQLRPMDLNLEVLRSMELLQHTLPKMISIKNRLAPDLAPVNADPGQISQIIVNLANNALQAMPEGGEMTVVTENISAVDKICLTCGEPFSGDWVRLTVSDTGNGIDPQDLTRIFDPFFTTKAVGQGTGLGLSMVHGIVLAHGGHIECDSRLGQGTSFKIYLPVLKSLGFDAKEDETPAEVTCGGETILLVDDEDSLRQMGQRILNRMGYQVLTAGSGEEALETFRQRGEELDLVVLDLGMPGMGGHKCLKEMLVLNPQAKVLIASGYAAHLQVQASLNAGAVGYVAKPFRRDELLSAIRTALQEK